MKFMRLLTPAWLLAVGLFATWLRFNVVEDPAVAHACVQAAASAAECTARQWVVQGFLLHLGSLRAASVYGVAALVTTAWTCFSPRRWVAVLAASLGLLALQLYSAECGALALLVGSLRLVHMQFQPPANAPFLQADRHGRQHAQQQP